MTDWLSPAVSGFFAALSCFAWWRTSRALRRFIAGPKPRRRPY